LQSQATEISDHCPLLLGLKEGIQGKKRFHFKSFWTKLEGFHEAVEQSWSTPVTTSCPLHRISIKLKRLARALQSWSQKKVGNISAQLGIAREILHRLEIARDSWLLIREEGWLQCESKRHCLVLASLEHTITNLGNLRR
jgi:hypothetical protein